MATATLTGKQLMLTGLSRAEGAHKEALARARRIAERLGQTQAVVTADDVFMYMEPKELGNAAGGIFRDGPWEFCGWKESTRKSNHGRPIRAWRLRANS